MKEIRTVLIGLGTVNIGLLKILAEKRAAMTAYGIHLKVVGVADSSGIAVNESGFQYGDLIKLKEKGLHANTLSGYVPDVPSEEIVNQVEANLLIEGSPVNLETGNPGLQVIRDALTKGWSVVSANKAPLVLAFDELHQLASRYGGQLLYSATVCGGLPVINILKRDLRATELVRLQGIFNATSNFILQELENGGNFNEAIKRAQDIGAAEADPSLDIDGYDSANKLYIIMKSFTDFSGNIGDIALEGIRKVNTDTIAQAQSRNKRIKLIATAERTNHTWSLSVKPIEVDKHSFLGNCDGWEMGLQLRTDYYEEMSLKLREEEPMSTCAAVIRDVVNIFT